MPTINAKQVVLMIIAMIAFTATGITALEPVIGVTAAKAVAAIATFLNGLMAAAMTPFLGNSSIVKDAGAIKGVDVQISREAPQNIAALAVDAANESISPAPGEERAVAQKAAAA